jgi:hypothetical protein
VQAGDSTATKSAGAQDEENTKADLDREVEHGVRSTVSLPAIAMHRRVSRSRFVADTDSRRRKLMTLVSE